MAAFGKELQSNKLCQLVLASSSPRRQELVASLDLSLPVRILSTDADESIEASWSPAEVVEKLAQRKAAAAAAQLAAEGSDKPSLVIGADTIVVLDGEVLGKPINRQDAVATLMRLQGRSHDVFTGVACIHSQSGTTVVQHRRTQVWMKPLSQARVERYVATGEPMDKAGSYGIQGLGSTIVERIEGCYFNVVGLPLSLLADMLEPFGVDVY